MKRLFLTIIFICLPRLSNAARCADCNVILISLDTFSASRLSAYGSKTKIAPNLDAWAEKSRVYKHAYSTAPWTLPAHGSMLTGYYPWTLGLSDERDQLTKETPYLATTLQKAGYKTFAVTSGHYVDREHGFRNGFETFKKNSGWKDAKTAVEQSLDWIGKNRRKKFFAFIHSYHAHAPFEPSAKSIAELDPNYSGKIQRVGITDILLKALSRTPAEPADLSRLAKLYDAGIRDLDLEFAKLFETIEKWGLLNNTIVIVTSDHGEAMGEHGMWGLHAFDVYEELVRIPLLIRAPRWSSKQMETPVSLVDIVPTISDLLGLPNQGFEGRVLPESDTHDPFRPVFAETAARKEWSLPLQLQEIYSGKTTPARFKARETLWPRIPKVERMVRSGPYKLILKFDRSFELYDVLNDPQEKKNLANEKIGELEGLKTLMLRER